MKSSISLLQIIGLILIYAPLGYLLPVLSISLNPFAVAPFWVVLSAFSVMLVGCVLWFFAGRLTPTFEFTWFLRLGIYGLSLVLFMGAYQLSPHPPQWVKAFVLSAIYVAPLLVVRQGWWRKQGVESTLRWFSFCHSPHHPWGAPQDTHR
jgi:hypothetical protein